MPAAPDVQNPAAVAAVNAYIAKAASFAQPVLAHLRAVVHAGAPGVVEQIKWSRPFFVYRGVILGNMSAFQQHCSFGLWGGQMAAHLRAEGVASSEGMGTFGRIVTVSDLPPRAKLVAYVREAARAIAEGERTQSLQRPRVAKVAAAMPPALVAALAGDRKAASAFEALSPGCRREYIQWIVEAKREDTRDRRIRTTLQWVIEGKSRHWKYAQA